MQQKAACAVETYELFRASGETMTSEKRAMGSLNEYSPEVRAGLPVSVVR